MSLIMSKFIIYFTDDFICNNLSIGVNLDEKVGGPYPVLLFTLSSFLFPLPFPEAWVRGQYHRNIFWVLFCCSWVLEHFGATKGWFLVKGCVVRNFWKFMWRAYILPLSSLLSRLIPSFFLPLYQSLSYKATIYTTRYCENNRTD